MIESVGDIAEAQRTATGLHLRVGTRLASELLPGDSVAVNGVCLTVTVSSGAEIEADIGPETMRVTTLGTLQQGHHVNLERSMRADARFGGHFVQGHVDGMGLIEAIRPDGDAHWLTVTFPPDLAAFLIRKGSIAVDGISLTVAGLADTHFDVMIIPFTWDQTNLRRLKIGDRVNLEGDMIGKYVARTMELTNAEHPRLGVKAR